MVRSLGFLLYILRVPQKPQREQERCALNSWLVVNDDGREMLRQKEEGPRWTRSDGQSEGADNAAHGLVLPSHGAAPSVFKWFSQLGEVA